MAAPTLDPIPEIVTTPGSTVRVQLVGHDADARTLVGTATLADSEGNQVTGVVTFVVQDPLTYSLVVAGCTVVDVGAGAFDVTVP